MIIRALELREYNCCIFGICFKSENNMKHQLSLLVRFAMIRREDADLNDPEETSVFCILAIGTQEVAKVLPDPKRRIVRQYCCRMFRCTPCPGQNYVGRRTNQVVVFNMRYYLPIVSDRGVQSDEPYLRLCQVQWCVNVDIRLLWRLHFIIFACNS